MMHLYKEPWEKKAKKDKLRQLVSAMAAEEQTEKKRKEKKRKTRKQNWEEKITVWMFQAKTVNWIWLRKGNLKTETE